MTSDIINTLVRQDSPNPVESDLLHSDGSRIPVSWNLSYQDDAPETGSPAVLLDLDAHSIRDSQATAAMFQTAARRLWQRLLVARLSFALPDRRPKIDQSFIRDITSNPVNAAIA